MVIFVRSPPPPILYMVLPPPRFEPHIQPNITLILNTCPKIRAVLSTVQKMVKSNCFTYSKLKHTVLTTKVFELRNSCQSLTSILLYFNFI